MNTIDKLNDKNIIAIDNGREPVYTIVFDFLGLPPNSNARRAKCNEYDRLIEALRGQGCKIGVWSPEYWWRVKDGVMSGAIKLR